MRSGIRQYGTHLMYALIQRENPVVQFLQVWHFILNGKGFPLGFYLIILPAGLYFRQVGHLFRSIAAGYPGSRLSGTQHFIQCNIFYISVTGLVARQDPHAHTKVDIGFEEQVRIITPFFQCRLQHLFQIAITHLEMIFPKSHSCGLCCFRRSATL